LGPQKDLACPTRHKATLLRNSEFCELSNPFAGLRRRHYGALLADPPWHHRTWSPKGQGRSPSRHYRTMAPAEIAALPVSDLVAAHCWLFLWAPAAHFEQAMALMRAWGFKYSSRAFLWEKRWPSGEAAVSLGHTTRKSCEDCLLGRRGRARRNSAAVDELIIAPRREHSRKPDEQYARIEQFCSGPYLELFARQRWPSWDAWGDEADQFQRKPDNDDREPWWQRQRNLA